MWWPNIWIELYGEYIFEQEAKKLASGKQLLMPYSFEPEMTYNDLCCATATGPDSCEYCLPQVVTNKGAN